MHALPELSAPVDNVAQRTIGLITDAAALLPAPSLNGNGKHDGATDAFREPRAARPVATPEPEGSRRTRVLKNVIAGAAHDLANLLCVVSRDLDHLASEALTPAGAEAVRSLRAEAMYVWGLTRELQMAATESEVRGAARQTRLAAWWPDMRTLLRAVHREAVIVRAEIPWGLPAVRIKPEHLTQAVLNLVGNAAQATAERAHGDNGRGERAECPGRAEVAISARVAGHGGSVSLTVADNSGGMSPDVLARACEPFFTTRAQNGGTGLGLAIVQRLVSDVGGCVRLSSSEGAGTSVTVELPIAV